MARSWFKKVLPCLLSLTLVFLLFGCGKKDDSSSASAVSESVPISSSVLASSGSDEGVSTSLENLLPSVPVLQHLAVGTFVGRDDEGYYPDERAPQIQLLENNSAAFRVNTGSEMGTATGEVSFSGSTLTVFVDAVDIDTEFWGNSINQLTFTVLDENHLEYSGAPFGLTQRGKIFEREGAMGAAALVQGSGPAGPAVTIPISDPSAPLRPSQSQTPPDKGASDSSVAQDASAAAGKATAPSQPPTVRISVEKTGIKPWQVIAIGVASAIIGGAGAVFLFLFLKKRKDTKEERAAQAVIRKEEKGVQAEKKKEERQEKKDEATQRKEESMAEKEGKKAKKAEKTAIKAADAKEKKARDASKKAAAAAQEAEKATEKAADAAKRAQGKSASRAPSATGDGKPDDE